MQDQQNESDYIVVPLEAQVAFSTFLYCKYQENVIKRLDKYLTFPQWLTTLEAQPNQLDDVETEDDDEDDEEEEAIFGSFKFTGFEWLNLADWGFGAALTVGTEYSAFDLYLGIFTLIWMCQNDAESDD